MAQLHTVERTKGEVVEPTATLKLIKSLGITRAAKRLGVSPTQLHKARNNNVVSKVTEVAAAGVLSGDPKEAAPALVKNGAALHTVKVPEPVLLEVPPDKAKVITRLCKALGATFVEA